MSNAVAFVDETCQDCEETFVAVNRSTSWTVGGGILVLGYVVGSHVW